MAIPWLTALKVIPWSDVIEHAPQVLKSARDLLERQRQRLREAETPQPEQRSDIVEMPGQAPPEVRELQQQLATTREDLQRQKQVQERTAQTLADLAEQNARLVDAVERLRKRTRWLMVVVAVLGVAVVWWMLR